MPIVFKIKGIRFFFYSNEHEPIHVHVEKDGAIAKIEIVPVVRVVSSKGFSKHTLKNLEKIVEESKKLIIASWEGHFG